MTQKRERSSPVRSVLLKPGQDYGRPWAKGEFALRLLLPSLHAFGLCMLSLTHPEHVECCRTGWGAGPRNSPLSAHASVLGSSQGRAECLCRWLSVMLSALHEGDR